MTNAVGIIGIMTRDKVDTTLKTGGKIFCRAPGMITLKMIEDVMIEVASSASQRPKLNLKPHRTLKEDYSSASTFQFNPVAFYLWRGKDCGPSCWRKRSRNVVTKGAEQITAPPE